MTKYLAMRSVLTALMMTTLLTQWTQAQTDADSNDIGRIVLGIYLPDKSNIPSEARLLLQNKLAEAAMQQGMGGDPSVQRFMLTAKADVMTKDIVAGPPQLIALTLQVTVFVGDATDNTLFSSASFSVKGAGINENKAFIDALKKINPSNVQLKECLVDGKAKIVAYYSAQCDAVIKKATSVATLGDHDQAIYMLSQVPDVCAECHTRCLDQMELIYQAKVAAECNKGMADASSAWSTKPNSEGAAQVSSIAKSLPAFAPCTGEMEKLLDQVESKLREEQAAERAQRAREEADRVALERDRLRQQERQAVRDADAERQRVAAYQAVATAYISRLPRYTNDVRVTWY